MKQRAKRKYAQPKTVSRWVIRALESMGIEYPEENRRIEKYKKRGMVIT